MRQAHCAAAALFAVSTALANDSQILSVYNSSLTTYRYTSGSHVQDVRPQHFHRGVHIDGSLREEPLFEWAVAGNPWSEAWNEKNKLGSVRLDVGAYSTTDVDMALPAPGFSWVVGRTYNSRQLDGSTHYDSDSYQGWNWFQTSQPEIVYLDNDGNTGNLELDDMVYLIYGADRFLEFKRVGTGEGGTTPSDDTFRGVNGTAGAIQYIAGTPDLYVYHDQNGMEVTFFGGDTSTAADWQLWKMEDPAGNVAYVGSTTASTAISTGYESSGAIKLAYDTEGRKYDYSYSTYGGKTRLASVIASVNSGTWVEVQRVEYDYYDATQACGTYGPQQGEAGDLKSVTVTTPLSQASTNLVETTYYRYWTSATYETDPEASCYNPGAAHMLKMVVGPEGVRKFDYSDATFDDDFETASDADLKPYSDAYFTYYASSLEVWTAIFDGECGCAGGVNGEHTFTYDTNPTFLSNDTTAYDVDGSSHAYWAYRTVIDPPDRLDSDHQEHEAWYTRYLDEVGQPLSSVRSAINPETTSGNTYWLSHAYRDATGCLKATGSSSHTASYTHGTSSTPDGSFTLETDDGLVYQFTRASSGDYAGLSTSQTYTDWIVSGDPEYLLWSRTFFVGSTNGYHKKTVGDFDVVRPLIDDSSVYATFETSVGTNAQTTSFGYSFHEALVLYKVTADEPTVSTGYAPTDVSHSVWYSDEGDLIWVKDATGAITYHEYASGQLTRLVEDANTTTLSGEGVTIPSGLSSTGTLHRETEWAYDEQGRATDTTLASGRVAQSYYTTLLDRRAVVLEIPRVTTGGSTTYYGPAGYSVYNHVGEAEAVAGIAVKDGSTPTSPDSWIDETDSDVILAFSLGGGSTLSSLTTRSYTENGRKVEEVYSFHAIPASMSAALHTEYELTKYAYNHMGLIDNVTDPTGTQVFRKYTSHGQMFSQGIRAETRGGGSPPGGGDIFWVSSGGHGGASLDTYHPGQGGGDGGGTGGESGLPTIWDCYQIVVPAPVVATNLHRTPRNQVRYVRAAGGPDYFVKLDNLGRTIAVAVYDANSTHTLDSNWTTYDPTTYATGRVALYEVFYDARGNRYKVTRHNIDPADGSDDGSLDDLTWVDGLGREIKRDGDQLTKRSYDALGRVTREYLLADHNDTTYAHAEDVAGDVVLEDASWAYDLMDNVLLSARVDRFHDSGASPTGPLDESDETGGDGDPLMITAADLNGRAQITTYWYDSLDRLIDTGDYGTNSGSDLDRDGLSVPSRPTSGVLLTSYAYDDAGRRSEMTDPLGADTRWTYDNAGRTTEVIRNYVDGTAGGGTLDDEDLITEFEYWTGNAIYGTGQLKKIIANQTGGASDQVTEYTYGITSSTYGPDSLLEAPFTAGHVLVKADYPDGEHTTDEAVWYGYNEAMLTGQVLDQEDNMQTISYDEAKREVRRHLGAATGFDDRVDYIARTYDGLGRLASVTQEGGGSTVDQVKLVYDGWGNIDAFWQDLNSAVDTGGGSSDSLKVDYTYGTRTQGRNTVVRTGMTYPGGAVVSYGLGDKLSSTRSNSYYAARVDRVLVDAGAGAVIVANYEFLGANRVVGTTHPFTGGDVHSRQYGSTSGSYPDLDEFNRVTTSRWSKVRSSGSPVDWYQETIAYDNNSNITRTEHGFFEKLDALFTVDGLDRITDVEVGDYSSGSIINDRFGEVWDLTHLGNWDYHKLDLNGDGDYIDTGDLNDDRTFNLANELTGRDTDDNGTDNYTLAYDLVGNLTDDGQSYKFKYDPRGQLTEVKNQANTVIVKFRYNGLGYLISKQFDYDGGGTLDSDEWRHFVYDEQWRVLETYRGDTSGDPTDEAEADPKEFFVYHAAGQDGAGSYIDDLILRDRDAVQPGTNTDPADTWSFASDGTLEERVFLCQSWRADVVLVLDDDGKVLQRAWYSPYGVPTGADAADLTGDGTTDSADYTKFQSWYSTQDARADWNLDGSFTSQDTIAYLSDYSAAMSFGGRGVLTSVDLDIRIGYAGYRWDAELDKYHVRHRVYDPYAGRWINRDPLGYEAQGLNLYEYVNSNAPITSDPSGLCSACALATMQPEQPEDKEEKKKDRRWRRVLPGTRPNKDDWENPIRDIIPDRPEYDDPDLFPSPIDQREITPEELQDTKDQMKDLAVPAYARGPVSMVKVCWGFTKAWWRDRKKRKEEEPAPPDWDPLIQ